jgi:beta-N-acetylhexosaminidase
MTLDQFAARCLLPGFAGLQAPDDLLRWIDRGLGGVVLFGRNIRDAGQVGELTGRLRESNPTLVVATDEEGGDVTRLEAAAGSSSPGNLALGVVDDVELTREVYAAIGHDLGSLGLSLDFAPVADVNTNPDNPVIGVRSFGSDPELVARHVAAAVEGLQGAGVSACAKHFPGHGDTSMDSHLELPVSDGELEPHLLPFRAAIAAGVHSVMTAHVVVPSLGREPATINAAALGLLRHELGFDGAIVSDAIEMQAVAATVGVQEAAVRSLAAGVDALCLGADLTVEPVHRAVVAAVESGRLTEARLSEAAARLERLGSTPTSTPAPARALGRAAARRALRVSGSAALPAAPTVVELVPAVNIAAGRNARGIGAALRQRLPDTEVLRLQDGDELAEPGPRPLVVVVRDAGRHAWQRRIATELLARRPDAVVVETGLPTWRPEGAAGVVETFGAGRANLEAAAAVLTGD